VDAPPAAVATVAVIVQTDDSNHADRDGEGAPPARRESKDRADSASTPRHAPTPPRQPREPREPRERAFYLWILVPLAVFLVLTALILTTGTPSAGDLMRQASTSFGNVKRGTFSFEIAITPKGSATAQSSTIKLTGPFELIRGKPLPLANINYTVSSGGQSQIVDLLTTGDKAYSIVRGQAYALPPTATAQLRKATTQLSSGGKKGAPSGLSGLKLNFEKWLINPQVDAGAEIDGTPTWRTHAGVDVVAALKDLTTSAQALGGVTGTKVPKLTAADIAQLKNNFKNATIDVFVGRYDGIVRKVNLTMDFNTPAQFSATTGGISGGRLNLLIGISKPNRPVDVKAPANPLPFKALQSLGPSG
jgi:hypothetical protein